MRQDQTETAAGRGASRGRRGVWSILGLSLFGLLLFGATVIVTAPAGIVAQMIGLPPQVRSVSGSVWSGRAALAGGTTLVWQGRARGFLRGELAADLRLSGARSLLDGVGFVGLGGMGLRDVTGRGGSDLLALVPGTAACDGQANVDVARAAWGRSAVSAQGRIQITESTCRSTGGADFNAPALDIALNEEGDAGVVTMTTRDAEATRMGQARLSPDGLLKLRVEPAAAVLVPGLPTGGPTELEFLLN